MSFHAAVETVIDRIHRDVIGGAADIAKEVVVALAKMVADSDAQSGKSLLAELEGTAVGTLKVMSSFAPPINAMNRLLLVVEKGIQSGESIEENA